MNRQQIGTAYEQLSGIGGRMGVELEYFPPAVEWQYERIGLMFVDSV